MKFGKHDSALTLRTRLLGTAFLIPALLFIGATMVVPIGWNAVLSFASWNGMGAMKAAGWSNYANFFQDTVTLKGFYYSIFIAVVSSAIAIVSGLLLALLIHRAGRREGAFYRFVFFAPAMMPLVVIGLLFTFVLSPDTGLLNHVLRAIGLQSLEHAWLAEPGIVLWTIAVIGGWRFSGFVMMLAYTAIISLPGSLFEAAKLEGLGAVRQARVIILPLIMPTIRLVTMLMLILSFKTYDIVWAMTRGGPGDFSRTVPVRMLDVAFRYNEFGYSAAISVMLTIVVALIIALSRKLTKGNVYEY
ncbi:carbohydrate ABC transporter permease [Cohnella sp. GCM10020058]|uniref:carbohydrate ABC transporter permease n=1 Tax=Cohnella sp. GCM10020058 TaxID=3317330 RepID=UPI003640835E